MTNEMGDDLDNWREVCELVWSQMPRDSFATCYLSLLFIQNISPILIG